MSDIILKTRIIHDEYTDIANSCFDLPIEEESTTIIKNNIQLPEEWNIGLIFGESGSGKSILLSQFGKIKKFSWDKDKAIISCLNSVSPEEASKILSCVGLSTVPAWIKPYNCLSNGQQFRADLARNLVESENELILVDEFTSVVDRNVAKAASFALQKYIRKTNKKIILASCHSDIVEWLQPDWIYNPTEALTHVLPRESLWRPEIPLKIFRTKYEAWDLFKDHHYLTGGINKACKCYLVTWEDRPVGFVGILAFPHAHIKNAWRESRTVILPDFQGLGIGVKISDYFGSLVTTNGCRYFSRTIHPAMVSYRINRPELWKLVKAYVVSSPAETATKHGHSWKVDKRFCYSFEYVGPKSTEEESQLFWEKV